MVQYRVPPYQPKIEFSFDTQLQKEFDKYSFLEDHKWDDFVLYTLQSSHTIDNFIKNWECSDFEMFFAMIVRPDSEWMALNPVGDKYCRLSALSFGGISLMGLEKLQKNMYSIPFVEKQNLIYFMNHPQNFAEKLGIIDYE